ncbi:WAP-type 'four-disulfide core [Cooperia oncophora]
MPKEIRGPAGCDSTRLECPRVTGGICTLRCQKDSDCAEKHICCSNGCGRECMLPARTGPIQSEIEPIRPVDDKSPVQQLSPISVKRDKPGTCPPAGDELPCSDPTLWAMEYVVAGSPTFPARLRPLTETSG